MQTNGNFRALQRSIYQCFILQRTGYRAIRFVNSLSPARRYDIVPGAHAEAEIARRGDEYSQPAASVAANPIDAKISKFPGRNPGKMLRAIAPVYELFYWAA